MAENSWSRLLADAKSLPPGRFTRDHGDGQYRFVPNPRRVGRPQDSTLPETLAWAGTLSGVFFALIVMCIESWKPIGAEPTPHLGTLMLIGAILMPVGALVGWLAGQPAKRRVKREIQAWEEAIPKTGNEQDRLDGIYAVSLDTEYRRIVDLFDERLETAQGIRTNDKAIDDQLDELKGPLRGIVRWELAANLMSIQEARQLKSREGNRLAATYEARVLHTFELLDQVKVYALLARSKENRDASVSALQEVLSNLHALDEIRSAPRRLKETAPKPRRWLRERA